MSRDALAVVAYVAANGLAVGQYSGGNAGGCDRLAQIAAPGAVWRGDDDLIGGNAFANEAGNVFAQADELVFGAVEIQHDGLTGFGVCGSQDRSGCRSFLGGGRVCVGGFVCRAGRPACCCRTGRCDSRRIGRSLLSAFGQFILQRIRRSSRSRAVAAFVQLHVFRSRMFGRELVDAGGVRVGIVHLHAGGAVAGDGDAFAGNQACELLRCAACQLIVVEEHVVEAVRRTGAVMAAQVIDCQVRSLGLGDGAHERQVRLQKVVDVRFLAGEQPILVVVGKLGPAAVEELQHLAQALRAQAAHLHVFQEEQLFVGREDARIAAGPADGLGVGQHAEREGARRGDGCRGGRCGAGGCEVLLERERGLGRCA